jgi:hypothetical protein
MPLRRGIYRFSILSQVDLITSNYAEVFVERKISCPVGDRRNHD